MPEASHTFGGDIDASPTNDIALADGVLEGQQRVLRRLLTNPGDDIWNPDYGTGLAAFIGRPADAPTIEGIVVQQMLLEECVAPDPAPSVSVVPQNDGTVTLSVAYVDAPTGHAVQFVQDLPA